MAAWSPGRWCTSSRRVTLTLITRNASLLLTYSPDARGDCPHRLFFKQSPRADEARFYQKIAPMLTHTAAPICYDAQYDAANSHVLFAYIEQTHFAPPEALPMPLVYHEMIVDALADLHRQFWDHPQSSGRSARWPAMSQRSVLR